MRDFTQLETLLSWDVNDTWNVSIEMEKGPHFEYVNTGA